MNHFSPSNMLAVRISSPSDIFCFLFRIFVFTILFSFSRSCLPLLHIISFSLSFIFVYIGPSQLFSFR